MRFLDRYRDHGLLLLRVGIGVMFLIHGWPKVAGGPAFWTMVGGSMANFGLAFAPAFWGFLAAMAEFGGGLALIFGLAVRPAAAAMAFTMLVATVTHFSKGDDLGTASHAIELGIVFLSLILMGAGRFSLDARLGRKSEPTPALQA